MPKLSPAPTEWPEPKEHRRKLAIAINRILDGAHNHAVQVTLRADETTTVYEDERLSAETVVTLTALTANAAAALATTYVVATRKKITIHHASDTTTDRRFGVAFHGA